MNSRNNKQKELKLPTFPSRPPTYVNNRKPLERPIRSIHIFQEKLSEKPDSLHMYPVAERGDVLTPESFSVEDSKDLSETEVTVEKILWHFYIMNNIKSQGLNGINLRLLREAKQPDHLQQ